MKIKTIEIKDRATLADVKAEFTRVNVIYGQNAVGKTLLSEVFRCAERSLDLGVGSATIMLDDHNRVTSEQFTTGRLRGSIRVFNSRFIEENVFVDNPDAIILGGDVQKHVHRIGELEDEVPRLSAKATRLQNDLVAKQGTLRNDKAATAQSIKAVLSGFHDLEDGNPRWLIYDRRDLGEALKEISDAPGRFQRTDERLSTIRQALASASPPLKPIRIDHPPLEEWKARLVEILGRKVDVRDLPDPNLDESRLNWLRKGLALIGLRNECPFCLQTVPLERADALKGRFSRAENELRSEAMALKGELNDWSEQHSDIHIPPASDLMDGIREAYGQQQSILLRMLEDCNRWFNTAISAIDDKLNTPADQFGIGSSEPRWNSKVIDALNDLISQHNNAMQTVGMCHEYERGMIAAKYDDWSGLQRDIDGAKDELKTVESRVRASNLELEQLSRESDRSIVASEELTQMLAGFVGHREFRFALNEDRMSYTLMRGNRKADAFSEGERTAIGLMYFLKSLEHRNFDSKDGVVVIDDPVTSFDDDRLFDAISRILVRTGARGENAVTPVGQLFLLTHHIGLLDRLWRELGRKATFFTLKGYYDNGVRKANLQDSKHPARFPYHVAFDETTSIADGRRVVHNPWNSLRKCAEGFAMSIIPTAFENDNLEKSLAKLAKSSDGNGLSDEDVHTIYNLVNEGSHMRGIDQPVDDEADMERAMNTARTLRNFMQLVEPAHFNDMERGRKMRSTQP